MAERKVIPFGTGPGVFGCAGPELRVAMAQQPGSFWVFIYESDGEAETAMSTLRSALDEETPVSERLRQEYNGSNMRAFLAKYLSTSGLVAFHRAAMVTVDVHYGAREVTHEGEYLPLNPEDVVSTMSFEEIEECTLPATARGELAMKLLEFPEDASWGGMAVIRDQLGPSGWIDAPKDRAWRTAEGD